MKRCKILRSLDRVFVFEFVLRIGAPSKDPARFVDLGFGILRNKRHRSTREFPINKPQHRMGDGHVVHSCGDCEVKVPMGSRSIAHRFYMMGTEAFDFVLGTDFFVEHSQILSSPCKHPTSSKWTMVMAGNLYLWSSLSTRLGT